LYFLCVNGLIRGALEPRWGREVSEEEDQDKEDWKVRVNGNEKELKIRHLVISEITPVPEEVNQGHKSPRGEDEEIPDLQSGASNEVDDKGHQHDVADVSKTCGRRNGGYRHHSEGTGEVDPTLSKGEYSKHAYGQSYQASRGGIICPWNELPKAEPEGARRLTFKAIGYERPGVLPTRKSDNYGSQRSNNKTTRMVTEFVKKQEKRG
jgi:hypothetical protein